MNISYRKFCVSSKLIHQIPIHQTFRASKRAAVTSRGESDPAVDGKTGKGDLPVTPAHRGNLRQRLNSVNLSDPFFLQDLKSPLASLDVQTTSGNPLECHQSSLLTARPA